MSAEIKVDEKEFERLGPLTNPQDLIWLADHCDTPTRDKVVLLLAKYNWMIENELINCEMGCLASCVASCKCYQVRSPMLHRLYECTIAVMMKLKHANEKLKNEINELTKAMNVTVAMQWSERCLPFSTFANSVSA